MIGPVKMGSLKAHKPQQANRSRSIALLCGVLMLFGVAYMSLTLARKDSPAGAPSRKGGTQAIVAAKAAKEKLQRATILAAKALDPLTMQYALPEGASFLPDYKNPCWKEGEALRCLPYAYILGSFQSGTNTLFAKLAEHPEVVTNEVSRWQFWAEEGKTMQGYVDKHSSGQSLKDIQADPKTKVILDGSSSAFAFYWSAGLRAHRAFQSVMVPCWRECSEGSKGKKEALMKCTEEKCFTRAMAADLKVASGLNLTYDQLHLPLLMSAAYGVTYKPRLMVLLRDPIDRLHCAYWQYHHYNHKYGKTAQGFLTYVKEQVGALKTCAARFVGQTGGDGKPMGAAAAERHCALYFEALGNAEEQIFFHADQFMRGMYAMYLEVWLRHFPRDSILVLRSEQYFANNEATVDKVIGFLNLSSPTPANKKKMVQAGKPNSCKAAEKMLPEAEKILLDLYRPYNQQLADLLGDKQWLEYNAPRQQAKQGAS